MLLPSIFNDNVFDDFMDGFDSFMDRSALYGKHGKNLMKTDVRDVGDHYELDMDLPGFKKDEVNVELNNGYLTVSAHKDEDSGDKDESGKWLRRERYVGTCSRSFYVGNVKPEDVKAKYEDGVLSVIVPKEDVKKLASSTAIAIE